MDRDIALLLRVFDQAFEKRAWHGPNLRGSLRGLSAEDAAWRPGIGRHNIWEIVVHAAYWKYAVWRRILNQKRGSFPISGSNWFRRPEKLDEKSWKADVALLAQQHVKLRKAIAELKQRDLSKRSPGSSIDNTTLIYGSASHDLYHAGQIQLIKRLLPKR
jgi:hypothetical protein